MLRNADRIVGIDDRMSGIADRIPSESAIECHRNRCSDQPGICTRWRRRSRTWTTTTSEQSWLQWGRRSLATEMREYAAVPNDGSATPPASSDAAPRRTPSSTPAAGHPPADEDRTIDHRSCTDACEPSRPKRLHASARPALSADLSNLYQRDGAKLPQRPNAQVPIGGPFFTSRGGSIFASAEAM